MHPGRPPGNTLPNTEPQPCIAGVAAAVDCRLTSDTPVPGYEVASHPLGWPHKKPWQPNGT